MLKINTNYILEALMEIGDLSKSKILSIETTGLGPSDSIIAICITDVEGNLEYYSVVNPLKPIPKGAAIAAQITDSDVAEAPHFGDIVEKILQVIGDNQVIAWNLDFTKMIFTNELYRAEIPAERQPQEYVNLMMFYHKFVKNAAGRWPKLDMAAEEMEVSAVHDVPISLAKCQKMAGIIRNLFKGVN